jgi:hypothetical protein
VIKDIERTMHIQIKSRSNAFSFRLRHQAQLFVQIFQYRHFIRVYFPAVDSRISEKLLVNITHSTVNDSFLNRLQSILAPCDNLAE